MNGTIASGDFALIIFLLLIRKAVLFTALPSKLSCHMGMVSSLELSVSLQMASDSDFLRLPLHPLRWSLNCNCTINLA